MVLPYRAPPFPRPCPLPPNPLPPPQVLSGEGWNEVMYSTAYYSSDGAVVYFLLIMVIGRFVLLNLFLAVLLDSFANEGGSHVLMGGDVGSHHPHATSASLERELGSTSALSSVGCAAVLAVPLQHGSVC
jgi:hypothetical protein